MKKAATSRVAAFCCEIEFSSDFGKKLLTTYIYVLYNEHDQNSKGG